MAVDRELFAEGPGLPRPVQHGVLHDFSSALSLWANAITIRPSLLWQQLFNDLSGRGSESTAIAGVLAEAQRVRTASGASPWLRLMPRGADTRTTRAKLMISAHTGEARFCAVLPDLKAVVTLGDDGALRLWDQANGVARDTLAQGGPSFTCGATAAETNLLVAGDIDGQIHLWDLGEPRRLGSAEVSIRSVTSCALAPRGEMLVAGSRDGRVAAFDTSSGLLTPLWQERVHDGGIRACVLSLDSSRVFTAGDDGTVRVLEAVDGRALATTRVDGGAVRTMCLHPSRSSLLVGVDESGIQMWDLTSLRARASTGMGSNVLSICVSPDGGRIATGALDGVVRMHDADSLAYVGEVSQHAGSARSCAFSADGSTVYSVGAEGALIAAPVPGSSQREDRSPPTRGGTMFCAIDPTDSVAAVATIEGPVMLWSLEDGTLVASLPGHEGGTTSCAFDGKGRLYTAGLDRLIRVWDAQSTEEIGIWKGHLASVASIDTVPDASRVLSGDTQGTLRLWDSEGSPLAVTQAHTGMVTSCKVHPTGRTAVSAGVDGILLTWDLTGGSFELISRRNVGQPLSLSFDGDGALLAAGGWDGLSAVVKFDDARMCLLPSSESIVRACALSCDGSMAAFAGWDKLLRVYEVGSGREVAVLLTEADLMSCAMTSDGTVFVVGSDWDQFPYIAHLVDGGRER